MNVTLKEQYTACCQAYADLLLKLMNKSWKDAYWVQNRIGSVLTISREYCFPMSDIAYIIDNDVTLKELTEWHDYNAKADLTSMFIIDIDAWHKGASHASDADLDLLLELRQDIFNALEHEGEGSPEYANCERKFTIARERILNSLHIFASKTNQA